VDRHHKTMFMLAGLAVLVVTLLLVWCPPAICRALHLHTVALSDLSDFRHYVADETGFYSSHQIRAVRIDCAALRDEVVTALQTGRLTLGTDSLPRHDGGQGSIEAWHQGRLLHLNTTTLMTSDQQQAWAATVRAAVALQAGQDLAFLSRLFGGVILHVSHKQFPIVLFSDRPCF